MLNAGVGVQRLATEVKQTYKYVAIWEEDTKGQNRSKISM